MSYPKRPKDANQLGKYIVDLATYPNEEPVVLPEVKKKKQKGKGKGAKSKK